MVNLHTVTFNKSFTQLIMRILKIFSFCLLCSTIGCYYDVEEELYPTTGCSTDDMSYQNDILPLIDTNCYQCHDAANNFGGITLEGYDALKTYADNGQLVGVISHAAGFSPMPQGDPKLLDCEIEKIEAWISQGTLNN